MVRDESKVRVLGGGEQVADLQATERTLAFTALRAGKGPLDSETF